MKMCATTMWNAEIPPNEGSGHKNVSATWLKNKPYKEFS